MQKGFFKYGSSFLQAVDDISFTIRRGETLGLVGESGCGKSTVGRTLLRLYEPTSGSIFYDGTDICSLDFRQMHRYRRKMQIIFQDPYASLNPRMTVSDIVGEPLDIHQLARGKERLERIHYLLETVGLCAENASRFPHEFSGGQRQRIGIARALAVNPEFLVLDEPISALDVSIQAQIVNMLEDLQGKMGLTYLFIAHDLAMVKHISRRIAVMYLGQIVELAESRELYHQPLHPYTQGLLSSIPIPDPRMNREKQAIVLEGDVPSPIDPAAGCRFRTRCPLAFARCKNESPVFMEVGPNHFAACHHIE
jgi:oligopeptide transport system ATP-binding protein